MRTTGERSDLLVRGARVEDSSFLKLDGRDAMSRKVSAMPASRSIHRERRSKFSSFP